MDFAQAMRELLNKEDAFPCLVNVYKNENSLVCHWHVRNIDDNRLQIERIIIEAKMIIPNYVNDPVINAELFVKGDEFPAVYNIYLDHSEKI